MEEVAERSAYEAEAARAEAEAARAEAKAARAEAEAARAEAERMQHEIERLIVELGHSRDATSRRVPTRMARLRLVLRHLGAPLEARDVHVALRPPAVALR